MMIDRRVLSCFMIVALITQSGILSAAPDDQPKAGEAQVGIGELRQRLYDKLKPPISNDGNSQDPFNMPWAVMNGLVQQSMNGDEAKSVRQLLLKTTAYSRPTTSDALLKDMQQSVREIQSQQLISVGINARLSTDTDLGPQSVLVYQFAAALQTATTAKFAELDKFQRSLKPVADAALSLVRLQNVSQDLLNQAKSANKSLEGILKQNRLGDDDLNRLKANGDAILACLSSPAKEALAKLGPAPIDPNTARDYYERLSNVANTLNTTVTDIPANMGKLTTEGSVKLLASLGHFTEAQQGFIGGIAGSAAALQASLNDSVGRLDGGWDKLLSDALKAPITNGVLPDEVKRMSPFVRDFASIKQMLGRGTPPSVSDISGVLFSTGIISKDSGVGQAATAVSSIMQLKGDFSSSAMAVLNIATELNNSGVPIPGLKEAAPLLSSVSSIVQAAGPLMALTGFGGGFAAFQMLGGLGGGSDNSAQFAQIQQQLSQINAKLDLVLGKLDKLDEKITAQHEQVMNALEALGFDIERTRDLLVSNVHKQVRGPCRSAADPSDGNLRRKDIDDCNTELQRFYASADVPGPLTLKANLVTQSLEESALKAFRSELTIRQMLVSVATDVDCDGLTYPSPDIAHLNRKLARYNQPGTTSSCGLLVLGSPLLEPGILEEYVTDEESALNATAALGRVKAMSWWKDNGAQVRARWTKHELPILNQAVAQQAIVSGDVLIPKFAKFLDDGSSNDKLTQVWNDKGVFKENVVRYWIWSRMKDQTWIRTLYSFAWNSVDDRYWYNLFCPQDESTCSIRGTIHFTPKTVKATKQDGTTVDERIWTVAFGTLPEVNMPKPSEMNSLQLVWPLTLTKIVETRERLLSNVTGMQLVQQLWQSDTRNKVMNTLESVAVVNTH